MPIKLIKTTDGIIRKISDSYSVLNLLTINDSPNLSVWISTAENYNNTTKTTSDRVYYILEGELIANNSFSAGKGDVIFIPGNTEYSFKWSFKAILINSPAFKTGNETILKL